MSQQGGQIEPTIDRTPIGFKIYYSDETIYTSTAITESALIDEFYAAISDNVLLIDIFFKGEYNISIDDVWKVENYKQRMSLSDYYWYNPTSAKFEQGTVNDIPAGLPEGALKIGIFVTDSLFLQVAYVGHNDRTWVP